MANDKVELAGKVTKMLKGGKFEVELENGHVATCTPSGKIKMNHIKILVGDSVTVGISPYDLTKGIITWRDK